MLSASSICRPERPSTAEYPFVLTTGCILQHCNCGAQTPRTDILELVDTDVPEMHPTDIQALHLRDGAVVRYGSARGEALLPVVGSTRVLPGHLFTSIHFPASTVNVDSVRSKRCLLCAWSRSNRTNSIRKMK